MLAGDSHANWVSDLAWLDEHPYDPISGEGGIGVEFAGTAVTSSGPGGSIATGNTKAEELVNNNKELQWSERYYRGYFELEISQQEVHARYFGMPNITFANADEISLANFTIKAGENRLSRENGGVAGGMVANGFVRGGRLQKGLVNDTATGKWSPLAQGLS